MPYSVRCRYCSQVLLSATEQLGEREGALIRTHLETCSPNVGRLPRTIGELLSHLNVTVALHQIATEIASGSGDLADERLITARRQLLIVTADTAVAALGTTASAQGFSIVTANDVVDALRAMHDVGPPHAVVLDPLLPRDGAWVFASWLARDPRYASIARYVIARQSGDRPDSTTAFAGTRIDDAELLALLEGRPAS